MRTQKALTLVILAGLQIVWAKGTFENVEPMEPSLPIDPSWVDGPIRDIFDAVDSALGEPHIVGGKEVIPHSQPHQVALNIIVGGRKAFCGGSLISDSWVLTAAHCADSASEIVAVLGAHNITADEAATVTIADIIVHPLWNPLRIQNDIALLKLERSINLDEYVNPIRLPGISQIGTSFWGSSATMSGWGKDSDNSQTVSPVLRSVDSKVVTNLYCSFRYFFSLVQDSNICVSGWRSKGTCNGDSGGPLYVQESDGKKTLIGITSFGIGLGCEWSWPPVFTRVTSYLAWIHQTTKIELRP